MSHSDLPDPQLQNLLAAVTDALAAGEDDINAMVDQYQVPRTEVDSLLDVISRLHLTFIGVQPSPHFTRRLKQDLFGNSTVGVVSRVRHLPPRVQIAAGIALVAGFMLFSRHRLLNNTDKENNEVAALPETG